MLIIIIGVKIMTIPIKIETDLAQALAEINIKLSSLQKDVTDIKIGQVRLEAELKGEIKALDGRLTGEIKTLEAKVDGIGKRLDNQEFINRGILIGLIIAILGGFAKLFGVIGNP
jgi:multidrug efflux pump subunit AcrA (membrane-fusion protein)